MTQGTHPEPSSPLPTTGADALGDPELIALVRAGDSAAYEELFLRHREVAIRYARRLSDIERAEDLCAEAFTKILDLLQRGKGPDVSFRAYLLTTVRTSHMNNLRAGNREELVPDHEPISRMVPVIDDPDGRFDRDAICRAFYQLPERWQVALWLTAVEGLSHDEASTHLGIRANAVASLTFRARAGLRQAYLSEHLLATTDPGCRGVLEQLPGYTRNRLSARRHRRVEEHLETCASCTKAALELSEVDNNLGALLAPLALTGFAVGGTGLGLTSVAGQAKAWGSTLSGLLSTKVATVAAVTAVSIGVGLEVIGQQHHPDQGPMVDAPRSATMPVLSRPVSTARPLSRTTSPARSASPATTTPSVVEWVAPPVSEPTTPLQPTTPPASPTTAGPGAPPNVAPRTMAFGTATAQDYQRNGFWWKQVLVPVSAPTRGTTLDVTSTRTIQVSTATTAGTGWVCGIPTTQWLDGLPYASTLIRCIYDTTGTGQPLRFDYQVAPKATMTAKLTPPAGCYDTSLIDNLLTLLLGD